MVHSTRGDIINKRIFKIWSVFDGDKCDREKNKAKKEDVKCHW